jgi:multisite-specific tRNA:(cytosine-C5)-methyltransferase
MYLFLPCFLGGFVVANDADLDRCYTLVHQIKRLNSPAVAVTQHRAQHFPTRLANSNGLLSFDRILCDVPCSGDGTLRKAPDLWARWSPAMGNGLHGLQCSIAERAVHLLQVTGRFVYSTCSLNPIEDEAVVANILRITKGIRVILYCFFFSEETFLHVLFAHH